MTNFMPQILHIVLITVSLTPMENKLNEYFSLAVKPYGVEKVNLLSKLCTNYYVIQVGRILYLITVVV